MDSNDIHQGDMLKLDYQNKNHEVKKDAINDKRIYVYGRLGKQSKTSDKQARY